MLTKSEEPDLVAEDIFQDHHPLISLKHRSIWLEPCCNCVHPRKRLLFHNQRKKCQETLQYLSYPRQLKYRGK